MGMIEGGEQWVRRESTGKPFGGGPNPSSSKEPAMFGTMQEKQKSHVGRNVLLLVIVITIIGAVLSM